MRYFVSLILLLLLLNACKKVHNPSDPEECLDGFIYWGGELAADGIGFYFSKTRDGVDYPRILWPDDLPERFKVKSFSDSSAVTICLMKSKDRASCFCSGPVYYYNITSIKRR